jgi:hypothetical protein
MDNWRNFYFFDKRSHLNLLLWNCWTKLKQIWLGWSLGGPLSIMCPTAPPSIQDGQTGSRNLTSPKTLPTIWYTYMTLVTKYQIPVINSYWEKCIWSQASYRYPISWEAFLDPLDSYFLFADFVDFYTHWTYMLIFRRIFLSN